MIRLIRAYLNSAIMSDGVLLERYQGTPQGGHCFARYADDCNVYVRSHRAGERVMALLRGLYAKLHLQVNETNSAVASAFGRKFLGYSFWVAKGAVVKRGVTPRAGGAIAASA